MTSVASDLTEKIRETLKRRTQISDEDEESVDEVDTGELSLMGSQVDKNI